jgi:magnesium chelatase subunit D
VPGRTSPQSRRRLERDDLRRRVPLPASGGLYVFVVDASDSMNAGAGIALARATALALLRHAGKRRLRVALVAASGTRARVLMHPTTSTARATGRLDSLRGEGETPLAHGLVLARRLIRIDRRRSRGAAPTVIVISDGHGNVPLRPGGSAGAHLEAAATGLAATGARAYAVDTTPRRGDRRPMRAVAAALGAEYVPLAES